MWRSQVLRELRTGELHPFDGGSTLEEYAIWDNTTPGISFNAESGRINIFKTTLMAMGYPEYFRFRFSAEDMFFGIEPCGIDDEGAKRLPDEITRENYEIKSIKLVRFIYKKCGWQKRLTYRIPGDKYALDSRLVVFDLRKVYEIYEGRVKVTEQITRA